MNTRRGAWGIALATVAALAAIPGAAPPGASAATPRQSLTVTTESGQVRGTQTGDQRLFHGIPYAGPPTGDHRWAPPRPVRPWPGVKDATAPGPLCPQVPSAYAPISSLEEDCLVLNITTPTAAGTPRPVLVWVHGDGSVGGGEFFGARHLVDRGLVVVTINYRLGIFGGYAQRGLPGSGTFGLQDQQAALRWVQRNARAFGGDPRRVTVAGSSFGASAIVGHLTSPGARGLFQRAVLASGEGMMDMPAGAMGPEVPAYPWFVWRTEREMRDLSTEMTSSLGCAARNAAETLRCLRAVPVRKILQVPHIMNAFQAFGYGNEVLPQLPPTALDAGRLHRVPVLSGATLDEHRTFVGLLYDAVGRPFTVDDYDRALTTAFGKDAATVARAYPLGDYPSPGLAWATVVTDRMWALGTDAQHTTLAHHTPLYAYEFADRDAPMYLPLPGTFDFGAYHAGDTPYVFDDEDARKHFTPAQQRLSDTMTDFWAAFARSGAPTGQELPSWPRYRPGGGTPHTQSLAPDAIGPVDYAQEHNLDFWHRLGRSGEPLG